MENIKLTDMKKIFILILLIISIASYSQVQYGPPTKGQLGAWNSASVTLSSQNVLDSVITGQAAQTATVNNILTATSGSAALNVSGYRSVSVQVISTGSGGTFIFEGSNDNTNFQTIPMFSQLVTNAFVTAAVTATSSNLIYIGPINFTYFRLRIATTITGGSIQAFTALRQTPFSPAFYTVQQPTGTNLNTAIASGTVTTVSTVTTLSNTTQLTPGTAATNLGKGEDIAAATGDVGVEMLGLRNDALTSNTNASGDYIVPVTDLYGSLITKDQQKQKRTYRAAFVVAPATAATDIFQLIGSASTTVEITKFIISGTQTTGGMADVYISKRSAANTGGTSSATTNVPMISTDASATAVGAIYTANPTPGAAVGDIYVATVPLSAITAVTNNIVEVKFGELGKPLILSGVAQAVAIRLNGATVTGGSIKIVIEWTEY